MTESNKPKTSSPPKPFKSDDIGGFRSGLQPLPSDAVLNAGPEMIAAQDKALAEHERKVQNAEAEVDALKLAVPVFDAKGKPFKVNDRVRIKPGREKNPATRRSIGRINEFVDGLINVKFDGIDDVVKGFEADDLERF